MSASKGGLRAGVIGVGKLGRIHARIYSSLESVGSLLVYDRIESRARETAGQYGAGMCTSMEEVFERCDIASICTPATHHHEAAVAAFQRSVNVLVEKPIARCYGEGEEMVRIAGENGCILQVGHVERFNGAFQAVAPLLTSPMFIESHRLATFSPDRGTDVSVVVDLMIHDIDLVLSVLRGREIVDLKASGTRVLTGSPDIVNARIEFDSGCVANITASRISREPLRKIRFFQENLYVSADLGKKTVEAFEKSTGVDPARLASDPTAFIRPVTVDIDTGEPLLKEIVSFVEAVVNGAEPAVTGREGLAALGVAERILESIAGEHR